MSTPARRPQVRSIVANAGSLSGTTVVTALLGFAFWGAAARLFPPDVVGYGSAAVSATMLLGTIGTLGLGTALIGELAVKRQRRGPLVAAALLASATGSTMLATGFVLATFGSSETITSTPWLGVALFVVGVGLTGATLVLDCAFIGMLRGGLQLHRNVAFSIAKLVVLYGVGTFGRDWGTTGIVMSWTIGIIFSIVWVAVLLRARGERIQHLPVTNSIGPLVRSAAPHNWLNLALESPHLVTPILATTLVSATSGAAFYAAWTMLSLLYILPFHLGTVLYATGSADPRSVGEQLRFTLRVSVLGGLVGVPGLVLLGPVVLSLFGPLYHDLGTTPLRLLALGFIPMVVVAHFVALCRIRRRVVLAASVLTIGGLIELAAATAGALSAGLLGLSAGVLAGKCLQGASMVHSVVRAARAADESVATTTPIEAPR